jgi:hypothetical protein
MVDNDLSIAGVLRKLLAILGCFDAIPEAMVGVEVPTDKRMWFGEEWWEESDNSGWGARRVEVVDGERVLRGFDGDSEEWGRMSKGDRGLQICWCSDVGGAVQTWFRRRRWIKELKVGERRWEFVGVEIGFLEEDDVVVGVGAGVVECFEGGGFPFGAI